jgi:hypothetical protein
MREIGQLQPIAVAPLLKRHWPNEVGIRLVFGLHRIEAAKRLGWTDIHASIFDDARQRFSSISASSRCSAPVLAGPLQSEEAPGGIQA